MDINVNLWAVLLAAVVQFIAGAVWYMPLFGKKWGEIHGFNTKSKAAQDEMRKGMAPLLVVQFIMAAVTAYVLAHVIGAFPEESAYKLAAFMWFGFIVPTQVGAVIFGGTESKWFVTKIAIMAGGALVNVLLAAWVLSSLV